MKYAEILIGPVRDGTQERVIQMLTQLNIEAQQALDSLGLNLFGDL